ncbi:WecB/TagA/CpsF family glycosyltransferase [Paenibacillus beijingensis]|uniref:N-acetylglucosaminyldiphosphoundecaprenol N-acetyl-beta-D-mannosaminyltransferase n=1 Tax=Paenibacillus beijingensis TaxID=1126833 RepID=A0A0D5NGL7_9BACL|nr:WecB/TagA/CpsF family glycosyltransferase [Paenibacillus beijingensis]AJY74539.1 N-acetylmannosaminyltransferase [Paenibacillus beijingensis]
METNVSTVRSSAAAAEPFSTVPIFGVEFSKMGMNETVRYLTDVIERRQPTQVITANPIMVMSALENPAYMNMMQQADLIVPDGAGVVWAAGYVGEPVAERVPGFDLMHRLLREGESRGWSAYLLGTTQEVIEEAARNLQAKFPGIRIAGVRDGFFGASEDEEVVAAIRAAAPDMLFVARSADKQEPWLARYKHELGVPLLMGVGGSFDIIAGKLKRAPVVFQKLRLEWFYRLLQQPSRYKRMLVLPKFAVKVMREKENVTKRTPKP